MPKRQPGIPKDPMPKSSPPYEEVNCIIFDNTDHLTPEQKTWPVMRTDYPRETPPTPELSATRATLCERDRQLLSMLAGGATMEEIASRLGMSVNTVYRISYRVIEALALPARRTESSNGDPSGDRPRLTPGPPPADQPRSDS